MCSLCFDIEENTIIEAVVCFRFASVAITSTCTCVTLCRASVAVITDDPEHKSKLKESLSGVFNGRPFYLKCLIYSLTFYILF
jgi:hypothetical protein